MIINIGNNLCHVLTVCNIILGEINPQSTFFSKSMEQELLFIVTMMS